MVHAVLVRIRGQQRVGDGADAFHLPVGRPVTHMIYRDALHHSRLVLPFTARAAG